MSATATGRSQNAAAGGPVAGRSPLAQLLHALNQPLTGLQCSMEVALAVPRTPEQYVRSLRDGLELTERMRALVEAIREVADVEQEKQEKTERTERTEKTETKEGPETVELMAVLRETAEDLAPVAEVKSVRIKLECPEPAALAVSAGRRRMVSAIFRFLESALSLTARDNVLLIETGGAPAEPWIRVRWRRGRPHAAFSPPELGLMVAQASFEGAGAVWQRERTETFDTVTVRLPGVARARGQS